MEQIKEYNKGFNGTEDVVGAKSTDDSLVAKEARGSRSRIGKK